MDRIDDTTVFESRRSFLLGLAYRLLGSRAEAEDVVQDLFIKWLEADKASIATPAAWLTTACTRHCIDLLRSAQRSRLQYVGTWLPEPIHTLHHHSPEQSHELASSLSTAFLLLLERLTPKERAAYLLYDIFDLDYPKSHKPSASRKPPAANWSPAPKPAWATPRPVTSQTLHARNNC